MPAAAAAHRATIQAAHPAVRHAADPITIVSQDTAGVYVSVVHCRGIDIPPPIRLRQSGTPLLLKGTDATAVTRRQMTKPKKYKPVYKCTILIEKKAPAPKVPVKVKVPRTVRLNTGFGGAAGSVARHHPAK
jgi:hypothetical protein